MPPVLSDRALCSLEDVKEYLGEPPDDPTFEPIVTRLINAASTAFYRRSGREFIANGANPQTRRFDVMGAYRMPTRAVRIGDLATAPTDVLLEDEDGGSVQTLSSADYTLLPRVRQEDHPYVRLRMKRDVGIAPYDVLVVTGTFGFPAVPEDVTQAVTAQVMLWLARDVKNFSETFVNTEGRVVRPRELDPIVAATADSYRLNLLG